MPGLSDSFCIEKVEHCNNGFGIMLTRKEGNNAKGTESGG